MAEGYNKDAVIQEIEHFEKASEYKAKILAGCEAENLQKIIGTVEVICPHCSTQQVMPLALKRRCIRCEKSFQLYPKNSKSNLAYTEYNLRKLHLIHQWYSLVHHGKFMTIM